MSDLEVTGGEGGLEVAVDDLRAAATVLRRVAAAIAEDVEAGGWAVVDVGVGSLGSTGIPDADLVVDVARAQWEARHVRSRVDREAERLRELAGSTGRAATAYEVTEGANRAMVDAIRQQALLLTWMMTEASGRVGYLDGGDAWPVEVSEVGSRPMSAGDVPTSAASLLAGIEPLTSDIGARVIEIPAADGSTTWLVQVPGTRGGIESGGEDPLDWTSNVSLMLRSTAASKATVEQALAQAQGGRAGPRDRVVIAGYSQGGLVAAALASDPAFTRRHRVTQILTAGSPIDAFPIPDATAVLALQHRGDPMPQFDVAPPPVRRNWTTVLASPARGPSPDDVFAAHELTQYAQTAVEADRTPDPSVSTWRTSLAPAVTLAPGATATVHDYRSRRVPQRTPRQD
ncbi:PGAP1-like protein [Knoellia remsis]|uniref:PGAP1-like protein n=1 Tax=Knoellia remsis TaxID=407159 RepID=A0A2T0UN63_9MICO|nr:hypothetical protein [Knoellia remsis]PRY59361.1 PGAP1-like protein [Knoellia remsis]